MISELEISLLVFVLGQKRRRRRIREKIIVCCIVIVMFSLLCIILILLILLMWFIKIRGIMRHLRRGSLHWYTHSLTVRAGLVLLLLLFKHALSCFFVRLISLLAEEYQILLAGDKQTE